MVVLFVGPVVEMAPSVTSHWMWEAAVELTSMQAGEASRLQ